MIKWLAGLFIVWEAIIFVASANEEILHGWQLLAASAPTAGHAGFPPVERESCTAENTLNPRKKARLQTDKSDDDLLTIGLGTRGACPSHPSSFGQSSGSGVIPVSTKKTFHLTNNHENFKFKSHDHQLFPSCVSLEQVNTQASSRSRRRDFLSDFDNTHKTDASASTEHYIPLPKNSAESLGVSFNLGRKTQLTSHAPLTPGPLGNSGTHEQDGGRGSKRKMWSSWGNSLSLKTGVISSENDAQYSHATQDFLSSSPSKQLNKFSDQENCISIAQFNPQEIQNVMPLFQLGSNTPSYQNTGAFTAPVLSEGGRIPQEMSSMAGKNRENDILSLKPPEKGQNGKSWGVDQRQKSPISQPQNSLRAKPQAVVEWPRSTEPSLNKSSRPYHKPFESINQGSSSEYPENILKVSNIPKPSLPETITTVGNHPSQINGIRNYGRLKFNTDIFKGEGTKRSHIVELLESIPRPYEGKFLLTDDQLKVACELLKARHSLFNSRPSMHEIAIFMGNIKRWYQYWNTHANIDVESLYPGQEALKHPFVFPLFLLYVEMIISIIPFKQGVQSGDELNYPQEMANAIESYLKFDTLMNNPPENGESTIWQKKKGSFKRASYHVYDEPSVIVWKFVDFWMRSHYKDFCNNVTEKNCLHVSKDVKCFFNTIFTYGIKNLNKKL